MFPTANPIEKTQKHLYYEIYSVILPVCVVALHVNRCADTAVKILEAIRILIPKYFTHFFQFFVEK
jgi:hypothetical protein